MAVPKRVEERIRAGLKRLTPIILQQKARDVSEADTVTLVKDLLSEVMGYDKYTELTSEHAIRGTYCDLAVRVDEKLVQLIEVKSAGTTLDERHVKQAIDYAANQGVEWVLLTNASIWRLYQVTFTKPIDKRLLLELDLTTLELKRDESVERIFTLTKEGFAKGAHIELRDHQDATNRYILAALIAENESVVGVIRRELRRVVDVLVDEEQIVAALRAEVIKRDCLEGPEAEAAAKRVAKAEDKDKRANPKSKAIGSPSDQDHADAIPSLDTTARPAPASQP